jgi:hypothetical protein
MDYLTEKDVMKIFNLNERKVKALFNTEGFPMIRIGNSKYIRSDKLDKWLEEHEGEKITLDY